MMNYTSRRIDIAQRKERLLARIAQQRGVITLTTGNLERPAAFIDRGIDAVVYLKSHPQLLVFGAIAVLVVGRRNLAGWLGRGWMVWRAWRSLSDLSRKYGA